MITSRYLFIVFKKHLWKIGIYENKCLLSFHPRDPKNWTFPLKPKASLFIVAVIQIIQEEISFRE